MDVNAIALESLERAHQRLRETSHRIARAATVSDPTQAADTVDLSEETVGLLALRNSYEATLKAVQAADEIQRRTLDILA